MSDPFSYTIIGKAMEVHRALGPGIDEMFYHRLLAEQLSVAGIEHVFRPRAELVHRGIVADIFEADLVFPNKLVAELKCLRGTFDPEHFLQIICYQKYWQIRTGLLFDFGKESLAHRRVNYESISINGSEFQALLANTREFGTDSDLAHEVCKAACQILKAYGLGYRDTTYRGLLAAELQSENLRSVSQPTAPVHLNGRLLGSTRCDCLVIGGRFAVQVLALRRAIGAADVAILQTHLRLLDLPHGLILNFGKSGLEHRWVRAGKITTQRLRADKDEKELR